MTKRDFFRIIIKLFGLYSAIITLFTVIPANVPSLAFNAEPLVILVILGGTILMVALCLALIFKADFVIVALGLDKGFDDEHIEFGNLNNESIVKLALIIIGGFLIIDNLPSFIGHCVFAFKSKVSDNEMVLLPGYGTALDSFDWFCDGINLLLGYVFLANYKNISRFLNKD